MQTLPNLPKAFSNTAFDILNDPNNYDSNLVDGLIPSEGITFLVGESEVGKSLFAFQLAMAVALGRDNFVGLKLDPTQNRAMYITTEDGAGQLKKRISLYNIDPAEQPLLNNLFIVNEELRDLPSNLEKFAQQLPLGLIILDVFSDHFNGDLNNTISVRNYLKPFKKLSNKFKVPIIMVHHKNKSAQKEDSGKQGILGSQAIESASRSVIDLRFDPDNDDYRILRILKGNNYSQVQKKIGYQLEVNPISLAFEFTGTQLDLKKGKPTGKSNDAQLLSRVVELEQEGLSTREIAEKLTSEGNKISKSTVGRMLTNAGVKYSLEGVKVSGS
ncbi:AAA family ATPase [Flavihumibacter sp. UBA7668]|uniref:AAA family ATPase n=1 Tax=Flavihumibacter sp. UBA7668 TaxID=1946542 RepID=UPI0025B99732|nr:AAA family ATPase [Flavihumibacter sp. UBA7668]